MKNRLVLLLGVVALGCEVGEKPMQNSPATNRVLDHFAGGLRFGDSFDAAAQHGSLVDSHVDESGSTMRLQLPRAKHGLSNARLLGTASGSGNGASSRVYGIILFSQPESAQIALKGGQADAAHIFGNPGQQGCIGYNARHTSRATVWEDELGGGIALIEPGPDSLPGDESLTRLVVYPRGQNATDALPNFRIGDCQN
ncbi:MAG TPA: hypothetical protein VE871_15615 [Longimicrobium sp.]|nr:hypothetical protein [Longimicrobium sp.]